VRRFYVPSDTVSGREVCLEGPLARRLARVLRLRPGDEVALFDGSGQEYVVRLLEVIPSRACGEVMEVRPGRPEPAVEVRLYQSPVKGERFEWVLEKGTELGVRSFVPLVSGRAVVQPRSGGGARAERWRRIVTEAAEQCGRALVPEVLAPQSLEAALGSAPGLRIMPYEGEGALGLRSLLRRRLRVGAGKWAAVSLFIGPEGGFEAEEVRRAREAGVEVVSLGRRILRSETAGIVAAAAVLYELGELGR
jgi:16S rRNA (uracil1498-N3)-methyltransferase